MNTSLPSLSRWGRCPHGYVFPEHPADPRNDYLFGSACAATCRKPFLTDAQQQQADNIIKISSSIGFALATVLLLLWRSSSNKSRKNYLISTIIILSLWTTLFFLMICFDGRSPTDKLCYDNAIPRDQSDGPSVCTSQGALISFSLLAICLAWLAQAIDLYLTVVKGVKGSSDRYFRRYMALIFIYPAIATVLLAGLGDFGFNGILPYCIIPLFVGKTGAFLIIVYAPVLLIMIVGTILCLSILLKIGKLWLKSLRNKNKIRASAAANSSNSSGAPGGNGSVHQHHQLVIRGANRTSTKNMPAAGAADCTPAEDKHCVHDPPAMIASTCTGKNGNQGIIHIAPAGENFVGDDGQEQSTTTGTWKRTWKRNIQGATSLLAFLLTFLAFWIILMSYTAQNTLNSAAANSSYNTWQSCIYNNYDDVTDGSWMSVCGDQPEYYKHQFIQLYYAMVALSAGNSIAVCIPFIREFFHICRRQTEQVVDRELVRIQQIRQSVIKRALERNSSNNLYHHNNNHVPYT